MNIEQWPAKLFDTAISPYLRIRALHLYELSCEGINLAGNGGVFLGAGKTRII